MIIEVESSISSCIEGSPQGVRKSANPSVGSPIVEDVGDEIRRLLCVTPEKLPISPVESVIPVGGNPATPSPPDALLNFGLTAQRNRRLPVESMIACSILGYDH